MPSIKASLKTFVEPSFWIDALVIIGGYKGSQILGNLVGSKLPLPAQLAPFLGPALVIVAGSFVGDKMGRNLKLGAFIAAAETVLGMVGVNALGA